MRRKATLLLVMATGALLVAALISVTSTAQAAMWQSKVDPWVTDTLADGSETEFLVHLVEQADLSAAAALKNKEDKGKYVYARLTEVAGRTQSPVLSLLKAAGVEHRTYWVTNMIWVRGNRAILRTLASRGDIAHVYANPAVALSEPPAVQAGRSPFSASAIEWNINLVGAPAVWSAGYSGEGAVIGGQDTGYQWDHPALINQYRGWNGITETHDYNWHDAIHTSGGPCVADSPAPCDDDSHGTHTMGTMVGDDGSGNQIGIAPSAKWIGCRNMKQGVGTPATYAECYQWFIAPTDASDQNPDPAKAPHVINNSWSCPPSEGCTDPNVLLSVVENVRAAGIVTVHSAGNSGSSCGTVRDPAAIYDASFSVGATSSSDNIASFSSRGPVTRDGSNRLKPDISAPGVNVRSSWTGSGYGYKSGTSMAAPHVAGLVALLVSASPGLAGDVDRIEWLIQKTAVPKTTNQGCGGDGPSDVPNHVYGYGRIDALAAYTYMTSHHLTLAKTAGANVSAGQLVTYTLTVDHHHRVSDTFNVSLSDSVPSGTLFVTATLPHAFNGSVVEWSIDSMSAWSSLERELVVRVAPTATGIITNEDYEVHSNEIPIPISGLPVTTTVDPYLYYFPLFMVD
jgi:uncharacterized repeat protein (TIGR01451 family)